MSSEKRSLWCIICIIVLTLCPVGWAKGKEKNNSVPIQIAKISILGKDNAYRPIWSDSIAFMDTAYYPSPETLIASGTEKICVTYLVPEKFKGQKPTGIEGVPVSKKINFGRIQYLNEDGKGVEGAICLEVSKDEAILTALSILLNRRENPKLTLSAP